VRIKFEKGMTPEAISQIFTQFIRESGLVIGAVNIYIQTYDDDMKPVKFDKKEYFVCKPSESTKKEYQEDVARIRRDKIEVV